MTRILATTPPLSSPLTDWTMAVAPTGGWPDCAAADHNGAWFSAPVPGTAAQALAEHGLWSPAEPKPLHDQQIWYRTELEANGLYDLRCDGLATIADLFLDGQLIASSRSMFEPLTARLELSGHHQLHIAFQPLAAALAQAKGPRARWRPRMMNQQALRFIRTSTLGFMPGWCPSIDHVGPWKPVTLRPADSLPDIVQLHTDWRDGNGHLEITCRWDRGPLTVSVDGQPYALKRTGDLHSGDLTLANVNPWWPHTHGAPNLYSIALHGDGVECQLPPVGFRHLEIDRGGDGNGFSLCINGEYVFCRGVNWMPHDLVSLQHDVDACRAALVQLRDAGLNMIRVSGTTVYAPPHLFDLCAELGIMVWQDFMFANFDYPVSDPDFAAQITREAQAVLTDIGASPALAVLCSGSEIAQQAAMFGLPAPTWHGPLCSDILPNVARHYRPDVPYVPGSPSGGPLPFVADQGVTHYYGVGAYRRPLDDARRARVRFASECLAFAHVPDDRMADALCGSNPLDPRWIAAIPRDAGADWDFEQVREHYMIDLFGVDAIALKAADPLRYCDIARATSAHIVETTLNEWRHPGSITAGALVWYGNDLQPGPGWGYIDSDGRPKSPFFALKRACKPLHLIATDEGVNGLRLHVINEGPDDFVGALTLRCVMNGAVRVVDGTTPVTLAARQQASYDASALFGAFFDTTYAYRFGPPGHDANIATLRDANGAILDQAFHFPLGVAEPEGDTGLSVELSATETGWALTLTAERLCRFITIADRDFIPSDNHFHLAPGEPRVITLYGPQGHSPSGNVRALNARERVAYGAPNLRRS